MSELLQIANDTISKLFNTQYPLISIKSTIDGKTYRVRDMSDKQHAANMLANVRIRLTKLCDILEQKYPDKPQVKQMITNFRSDPYRFVEATPDSQFTSYSVNKGESMHLCLRERVGGDESLVNENVMTFVSLHELSHIITESIGHGPDFWNNFGWLIREAEAAGIYRYMDFKSHPVSYCGVMISDSPRYDPEKDGTNFQIGKITSK